MSGCYNNYVRVQSIFLKFHHYCISMSHNYFCKTVDQVGGGVVKHAPG